MDEFAILSNRKRALIALIHSIFFLGLAVRGFASPRTAISFHGPGHVPSVVMLVIYGIVAIILAILTWFARSSKEKLYFVLCVASASFGFIRILLGDTAVPAAQYLRVLMLASAVAVGIWIYRGHTDEPVLG
jgi:hypothetical protein